LSLFIVDVAPLEPLEPRCLDLGDAACDVHAALMLQHEFTAVEIHDHRNPHRTSARRFLPSDSRTLISIERQSKERLVTRVVLQVRC